MKVGKDDFVPNFKRQGISIAFSFHPDRIKLRRKFISVIYFVPL